MDSINYRVYLCEETMSIILKTIILVLHTSNINSEVLKILLLYIQSSSKTEIALNLFYVIDLKLHVQDFNRTNFVSRYLYRLRSHISPIPIHTKLRLLVQ